jgi:hypothetical protein
MDVVSVNPTNFIGLSSVYTPDETLSLNQSMFFTEQGFNLPFTQIYADLNDTTTNNYSNLYLTRYDTLTSNAFIKSLEALPYNGFSTYIGTYNTPNIDNSTAFLVVEEPPIDVNTANIALSGSYNTLDNRSFFEVLFLDSILCKVVHSNKGVSRYLTADSGKLTFQLNNQQDNLGDVSSQIFHYIYDPTSNILVLAKSLLDNSGNYICEYVGYTESTYSPNNIPSIVTDGTALTFFKPIQGANTPYPLNAILRCSPQPGAINEPLLYDNWVSYERDLKTNSQNINSNRSTQSVDTNLLVNTEYNNVLTSNALNVNILSLKNTNTPENLQSRDNPFQSNRSQYFNENDINSRKYNALFTGSNQEFGNDNVSLGYEAYTSQLSLPADKTTYFHTPQTLYPYIQINVADAGFIEAGAIAGDHPMKSDKIFKKLAAANYTTPYGNVSDETTGTFLCSWLSGGVDVNIPPIWVDRYYNPSTTTYIAALTGAPVNYITTFNTLVSTVDVTVFDKPSDLVLEPGAYYAYQHIGNNYVNQYLQSLTPFLVDNTFSAYLDTKQQNTSTGGLTANEFTFDGSHYTISNSLSSIDESNQFTLSFYGTSQNWQQSLGYQLVGNFVHDGFGIFNTNNITPTIYLPGLDTLTIFNTSLTQLKTIYYYGSAYQVPYASTPFGFMRLEGLRDYFGIFINSNGTGTVRRYDISDIPLYESTNTFLSNAVSFDYTPTTGYILCNGPKSTNILQADLINNVPVVDVTSDLQDNNQLVFSPGCDINTAYTITYYNGNLYLTDGNQARLLNGVIYYFSADYTSILRWDIELNQVTTAFKSNTFFSDFNFDYNGNIWILDQYTKYYSYTTSDRNFRLSGEFVASSTETIPFKFVGDGVTTTFNLLSSDLSQKSSDYTIDYFYTTSLSSVSSVFDNNNNVIRTTSYATTHYNTGTYKSNEYYINNNQIVFHSAPILGSTLSGTTTLPYDTYDNQFINVLNDITPRGLNQTVVVTRVGYDPVTFNSGYQLNVVSLTGGVIASTAVERQVLYNYAGSVAGSTNDNYLQNYINAIYKPANINVKAVLANVYNNSDTLTVEIVNTLSAVDPGPHHFAVRFDSYHGEMALFIDGQEVGITYFEPRKYKFSNLIDRPFMFGTATFKNNIPLFKYLQNASYLVNGLTIYNYNLYNTPLNDFDIKFLARQGMNIQDINVNLPCGRRNYIEEIERYFKASVPGSKSTLYNLNITNTGITDRSLQQALEVRILDELKKTAPAYSQINSINWID